MSSVENDIGQKIAELRATAATFLTGDDPDFAAFGQATVQLTRLDSQLSQSDQREDGQEEARVVRTTGLMDLKSDTAPAGLLAELETLVGPLPAPIEVTTGPPQLQPGRSKAGSRFALPNAGADNG